MADNQTTLSFKEAMELQRRGATPAAPTLVGAETGGTVPTGEVVSALPSGMPAPQTPPTPVTPVASPSPKETRYLVPSDPLTLDQRAGLPTAQPGWYDNPVMASRAVLDGMVFGFSDEIGAGVAAAAAFIGTPAEKPSLSSLITGEAPKQGWDRYKGIYREMMTQLQNERNVYTANNPKASLALNLAGAVASPLNKPLAFLSTTALKGTSTLAATGGDVLAKLIGRPELTRVQRALSRMQTLPTAAQPSVLKAPLGLERAASTAPPMLQQYVRGAAELAPAAAVGGSLYAAGVAQPGTNITQQMKEGAVASALFAPIAAALPVFRDLVTARRVAQSLGNGSSFVPLSLAADQANPALSWIYRNLVGRAFIGSGMLDNQASRWYTPLFRKVDGLQNSFQQTKTLTGQLLKSVTARATQEAAALARTVAETSRAARREIKRNFQGRIDRLRADAATAEAATTLVPQMFRSQVLQAAMPNSFPREVKDEILAAMEIGEYFQANRLFRQAWNDYGFTMLNNNTFTVGKMIETKVVGEAPLMGGPRPIRTEKSIDLSPVLDRLEKALDVEDLAALTVPGNKMEFVRAEADRFLRSLTDSSGRIKGSSLATLRSMISGMVSPQRMAGQTSNVDAQLRSVWLELKNVLDDVVQEQLSPAERVAFSEHKAAYRVRLGVDDAITSTRNTNGAFEPSDWDSTLRRLFRKDRGAGTAPFQREAATADGAINNAEATVVAAAQEARALSAQQTLIEMNNRAVALEREMARAKTEVERIKAAIPAKVSKEMFMASRTGAVRGEAEAAAMQQKLDDLNEQRRQFVSLLPVKGAGDLTAAQQWTATLLVGGFSILGGAPLAGIAATRGMQRALAGQTVWQEFLNDVAKKLAISKALPPVVGGEPGTSRRDTAATIGEGSTPARNARIYEALLSSGNLEKLRQSQPEIVKKLEADYKATVRR